MGGICSDMTNCLPCLYEGFLCVYCPALGKCRSSSCSSGPTYSDGSDCDDRFDEASAAFFAPFLAYGGIFLLFTFISFTCCAQIDRNAHPSAEERQLMNMGRCVYCKHPAHHRGVRCSGQIPNRHTSCLCYVKCSSGGSDSAHCGRSCDKNWIGRTIRGAVSTEVYETCTCNDCSCMNCKPELQCGCKNCGCQECRSRKTKKLWCQILYIPRGLTTLAGFGLAIAGLAMQRWWFTIVGAMFMFSSLVIIRPWFDSCRETAQFKDTGNVHAGWGNYVSGSADAKNSPARRNVGSLFENASVASGVEMGRLFGLKMNSASNRNATSNNNTNNSQTGGNKFCTSCGANLVSGFKFCGKCGTPVQPEDDPFKVVKPQKKDTSDAPPCDPAPTYDMDVPNSLPPPSIDEDAPPPEYDAVME